MSEVRSAARVLELLEYFAMQKEPASLTQIAEVFQIPKSSTHNLLKTLEQRGYIIRQGSTGYLLNTLFRTQGFGWAGSKLVRLTALAKPLMDALAATLEESITLSYLTDSGQIKIIMQSRSTKPICYIMDSEHLIPAYCTATGRIILACSSPEKREDVLNQQSLVSYTPYTITDRTALQELLVKAREKGYAISAEEYDLGGTGVAAAILDTTGTPIAALNVATVSARFDGKKAQIIASITDAARQLSSQLAHCSND